MADIRLVLRYLLKSIQANVPGRSLTPSDVPSIPVTAGGELTEQDCVEITKCDGYEDYKELKNMGGRPFREKNPDPGPCPPWGSEIAKGIMFLIIGMWNSDGLGESCSDGWTLDGTSPKCGEDPKRC